MAKIIILTGAGISVESGLETFQDNPIIRQKLDRKYANENWDEYSTWYKAWSENIMKAEPNKYHYLISDLKYTYKNKLLVATTNIDRLHMKTGFGETIYELHGSVCFCDASVDDITLYGDLPNEEYFDFRNAAYKALCWNKKEEVYFISIGSSKETSTITNFLQDCMFLERNCYNFDETNISVEAIKSLVDSIVKGDDKKND